MVSGRPRAGRVAHPSSLRTDAAVLEPLLDPVHLFTWLFVCILYNKLRRAGQGLGGGQAPLGMGVLSWHPHRCGSCSLRAPGSRKASSLDARIELMIEDTRHDHPCPTKPKFYGLQF